MADNTTIQARLSLRCDTYDNWKNNNPVLLVGEAAVTTVPVETGVVKREPAVLLKFGDGVSHYNDLQFLSAKSADVYDWAMQAQKPTYGADEIAGLEDYVAEKSRVVQYQLVRVSNTSFKLQSKNADGDAWQDVGSSISITYTLTEGTANGTVKFNSTNVPVHGLKSAAYQDSSAFDAAGTAAAAATEAKSYTDTQIAAKISSVYKPAGSTTFENLPTPSKSTLGNVYDVTNDFTASSSFVTGEVGNKYPAGTNVVVVYTGSAYKFDAMSGKIDLSSYATKTVAQGYANTAKSEAITAAASDATSKVNSAKSTLIGTGDATSTTIKGAVEEANDYADGLNTAMSARVKSVEDKAHSHSNKALLDTYTQTNANIADAVSKKHSHSNKTVLDAITSAKVSEWNAKVDDSDLAAIAKSGNINDLKQTQGTYIIINCGNATTSV